MDDDDLLARLADLAEKQKALRGQLEQSVAERTRLVAEARRRRIATWRALAAMFDMTQQGLVKAQRAAQATAGRGARDPGSRRSDP